MLAASVASTHHTTESRSHTDARIISTLLDWFTREGHEWPWRATRDPWRVLVSEVCLQQTQVARAAPFVDRILDRFPAPQVLASAPLAELLELWQGLGYPRRARHLWLAARLIDESGWPTRLRDLPGVGPYTDAAIRCFAFEEPVVPPDINTRRVIERLFPDGAPGVDTHPMLVDCAWSWGQAVMELGQRVCRATARCDECPVSTWCVSRGTREVIASPRQKRFAGSMRQRRGTLLKAVLGDGLASVDLDPDAAASLIADGLVDQSSDGELLLPPAGDVSS